MSAPLNPPKFNVSPLIRFSRWAALLAGIAYGFNRYNYLSKREIDIQKHETEIKERHRQKMLILKEKQIKEEMDALGKEAGVGAK